MRNRRRIFQQFFGFCRGMGFRRGLRDGTGPRAQMGVCRRYSQDNLTNYKQYLEEELDSVNEALSVKK